MTREDLHPESDKTDFLVAFAEFSFFSFQDVRETLQRYVDLAPFSSCFLILGRAVKDEALQKLLGRECRTPLSSILSLWNRQLVYQISAGMCKSGMV